VGPFINNLYWNFNNFDQAGHYSSSVPKNVFEKGMAGSLFLVASAYLLPILAATGATDLQQDDWKPGALAVAGSEIVGNWLGVWIVISSGISLASCFFAELSADSLQLLGMADRKKLPKLFSHRSRFDTPTYSIVACLAVIASVLPFDFGVITELCNFAYCFSVSVEFLAFAQLTIRHGGKVSIEMHFRTQSYAI
jgi:amino acid transporter